MVLLGGLMKYIKFMRYLLFLAFFAFLTVGCAQSKNMTRNDTVVDEESLEEDTTAFDGTESSDLDDSGWGNDDAFAEDSDSTQSNDGYLIGASSAASLEGNCSWYGREFHGRKTASGETFDMYALSAAHKTYPFGTVLLVTNLENGKSVQVRVNDRGPYVDDRILDVSYAAGRDLGMLAKGVAKVSIKVISSPDGTNVATSGYGSVQDPYEEQYSAPATVDNSGKYSIQCGAFYSKVNADSLRTKLESMFQNRVVVIKENDLYKVRVLDIPTKTEANSFKQTLANENIPGFVLEN